MAQYIKNAEFIEILRIYKNEKKAGRENSKECKRAYDKIGTAIYLIAKGLGKKPNFSSYSFREEMESDAIENCIMYLDNFDPDHVGARSKKVNPFSYFTQICWFAFLRRIAKEKKQSKIKANIIKESGIIDIISNHQDSDDRQYINSYIDTLRAYADQHDDTPVEKEEDIKDDDEYPVKKDRKPKGLEEFLEEDE